MFRKKNKKLDAEAQVAKSQATLYAEAQAAGSQATLDAEAQEAAAVLEAKRAIANMEFKQAERNFQAIRGGGGAMASRPLPEIPRILDRQQRFDFTANQEVFGNPQPPRFNQPQGFNKHQQQEIKDPYIQQLNELLIELSAFSVEMEQVFFDHEANELTKKQINSAIFRKTGEKSFCEKFNKLLDVKKNYKNTELENTIKEGLEEIENFKNFGALVILQSIQEQKINISKLDKLEREQENFQQNIIKDFLNHDLNDSETIKTIEQRFQKAKSDLSKNFAIIAEEVKKYKTQQIIDKNALVEEKIKTFSESGAQIIIKSIKSRQELKQKSPQIPNQQQGFGNSQQPRPSYPQQQEFGNPQQQGFGNSQQPKLDPKQKESYSQIDEQLTGIYSCIMKNINDYKKKGRPEAVACKELSGVLRFNLEYLNEMLAPYKRNDSFKPLLKKFSRLSAINESLKAGILPEEFKNNQEVSVSNESLQQQAPVPRPRPELRPESRSESRGNTGYNHHR